MGKSSACFYFFFAASCLFFLGCDGDSDGLTESSDLFQSSGKVYKLTKETEVVTISGGEAGAKYIVMPFALGETSGPNAVQGGDTTNALNFTLQVTSGAKLSGNGYGQNLVRDSEISGIEFDHRLRSLLNHFDPRREADLREVDVLEKMNVRDGPYSGFNFGGEKGVKDVFLAISSQKKSKKIRKRSFLNSDCEDVDSVTGADPEENLDTNKMKIGASSQNYCLYIPTEGVATVTDIEEIKAGIEKSLALYKTVIYKDNLTSSKDDYRFQPYIVVQPADDSSQWTYPKVSGAFIEALVSDNDRPTIIVASDQSKVNTGETDSKKLKEFFHSTISHELQHAVFHYYRYINDLTIDSPQFDEGLAHYMEDVLGYGSVNFSIYPQAFLSLFFTAVNGPALANIKGTGSAAERGAAQTFFYYLISQKGGVIFDKYVSGGVGFDFVRSYVAGTATNISGVISAYGSDDWVTTMGEYFGALAIDGASTLNPESAYRVQDPEEGINNAVGNVDKTFGMHYRNFGDLPDLGEALSGAESLGGAAVSAELQYYQTRVFLLELTESEAKLSVKMQQKYDNAGVTVVRIK